jgi:protocatechuate 3,4-dioxygenase beta subunit
VALAISAFAAAAQGFQRTPSGQSHIGVYYLPGAPASGELWRPGDPGQRLFLRGRVLGVDGGAVPRALIEIWHVDANGVVHPDRYRAALRSRDDGSFEISTVLPGYIWGPRHIHVMVTHPAHPRFITRIFFRRDPEVAISGRPDLAILLEEGPVDGDTALFGHVELVLATPGS